MCPPLPFPWLASQTRVDLSGRTPDYVLHRLTTLSGLHGGLVMRQCIHFTCNGSQPPLTALPPPLAFFTALVELDLSHNQLAKIDGLDRMTELTVLRLDHNALKQLEGLEGCRKLRHISVTHNQVWEKALLTCDGLFLLQVLCICEILQNSFRSIPCSWLSSCHSYARCVIWHI